MAQKNKLYRHYVVIPAIAAVLAMTTPMTKASATWIPDLVFPETFSQPKAKPDRAVTGSIPLAKRMPDARQSDRDAASGATRKGVPRPPGSIANKRQR